MKLTEYLQRIFLFAASLLLFTGCSDDDTESAQPGYGYVQFRLYKSGSYSSSAAATAAGTRAADRLDYLHEAAKLKVTLRSSGNDLVTSTVTVTAADKELAEWGMQSDKFQLVAGDYTLMSYEIYDALDNSLLLGEPEETTNLTVIGGGLVSQDIVVNVVERGWVKFRLTKDLSQIPAVKSRAAADGADAYPFHMITYADVTVQNKITNETTTFSGLKTTHEFVRDENRDDYTTGICKTDTIVSLKAGLYKVVGFRTYFDRDMKVYETSEEVADSEFVVKDNQTADADVPVTLHTTSGYIADAITLRKIWQTLDGPKWNGKVKWNFNCDVDIWLAQPGVQILDNGRIAALNFEGTGARGAMPAAIGELTELRQLYLSSHSFIPGAGGAPGVGEMGTDALMKLARTDKEAFRRSFHETFVENDDPYRRFPKEFEIAFKLNNVPLKEPVTALRALPVENDEVIYATHITSLPAELNKCTKLENLYIAYSPITSLPDDLSALTELTDVEIFNCPDLKVCPKGLATLPNLIMLTFGCNYSVPADALYEGIQAMASSPNANRIQGLYFPAQKLERVPDMSSMTNLAILNIQSCGVKEFEAPFGKDHPFVQFYAGYNQLSSLPVDEDGYFVGLSGETETLDFSNNHFTELPDIFSAKSLFRLGTVDFSFNQISQLGKRAGSYHGIVAEIFSLAYNKLDKFPEEFYPAGSQVNYLQLQGNGIEEISKEALEGEYTYILNALDLSYNKLKKLPENFHGRTFQYLRSLDMSYNRFDAFPYAAVNSQYMQLFILRHQRDEFGNRCMKEWPTGIGSNLAGLRALYLGSNDIRKVDDRLSYMIYNLDISDNPNIVIDVTELCPYIQAGRFNLVYDSTQDIRGCDNVLILDK